MSDTKVLNNRLDYVERQKVELEDELKKVRQQLATARSEATYFRTECRNLADRGNAVNGIEETLTRRLESLKRDAMPGDRYAAAAIIELDTVLSVVHSITGGGNA